jgi:hypothetical protein
MLHTVRQNVRRLLTSGTVGQVCAMRHRRLATRWWQVAAFAIALFLPLLVPRPVLAACDAFDLGACVDAAQYKFWMGVAGLGWLIDRMLLSLAYQLEVLRWWVIEQVFTSVYDTLVTTIKPGLAPLAIVAVSVGILAFLLLPWFGRLEIVDVRRALIWTLIAPVLLTLSGPWLRDAETLRTDIGSILFNASAAVAPGGIFGAPAADMRRPTKLYDPPVGACGGDPLARRFPGELQMDDMAAAMLYADAEDIHCPAREGPGQDIPDGFYETPDPNYATEADIANLQAAERAAAINNLQRGVNRLLLGIVPSLLAVLNALVQLIFSFALVALWISLPIGLLWVFFNETASGVTGLFRRIVAVLQASWSSSLLLGIVFAALLAAAQVGNAAAYSGLSMAGIFMTVYVLKIAVDTLLGSLRTLGQTIGTVSGLGGGALTTTAGSFAGAGVALATGGVGAVATGAAMGQTYAVAKREGGSRRYATAAAVGRLRPLSALGEVAASMGYENEVTDGLFTGRRGARAYDGWRSVRRFAQADARQTDAHGLTMREREQQRDWQHAITRARRGRTIARGGDNVQAVRTGANTAQTATGHPLNDPATTHRTVASSASVRHLANTMIAQPRPSKRVRLGAEGVAHRVGSGTSMSHTPGASVNSASNGSVRNDRTSRVAVDAAGALRWEGRLSPGELPAWSLTDDEREVNVPRLLQLGYAVQWEDDGRVTYWHPAGPLHATSAARGGTSPAPAGNKVQTRSRDRRNEAGNSRHPLSSTIAPQPSRPADAKPAVSGQQVQRDPQRNQATQFPPDGVVHVASHTRSASSKTKAGAENVQDLHGQHTLVPALNGSATRTGLRVVSRAGTNPSTPDSPSSVAQRARLRDRRNALVASRHDDAHQAVEAAQERLLLVEQGALRGVRGTAQRTVEVAEHQLIEAATYRPPTTMLLPSSSAPHRRRPARLHPSVRSASTTHPRPAALSGKDAHTRNVTSASAQPTYVQRRWYRPGTRRAAGIAPPTVDMLERAAGTDQILTINKRGYAVLQPAPAGGPPPEALMRTRARAVPDVDALLLQGYDVKPDGQDLLLWQRPDAPDAIVVDADTPQARHVHDLVRERRLLAQRGVVRYWPLQHERGSQRLARLRERQRPAPDHHARIDLNQRAVWRAQRHATNHHDTHQHDDQLVPARRRYRPHIRRRSPRQPASTPPPVEQEKDADHVADQSHQPEER